jgi:hypothetical protein
LQFSKYRVTILGIVLTKTRQNYRTLTSDDQTTLGCTQSCLSSEAMLCSTLVRFIAIFRSNITNMKFSRWEHQVLSICKHKTSLYLPQYTCTASNTWMHFINTLIPNAPLKCFVVCISLSTTFVLVNAFLYKDF